MAQWIPSLPLVLDPAYAYGTLQVRDEGSDRLRHEVVARLNLSSGAVFPLEGLSRDAYDWCSDQMRFRPYRTRQSWAVEEDAALEATRAHGEPEIDFCVPHEDLAAVERAWIKRRPAAS